MGFGLSRETTMKRHEISLSVPTPSVVRSTRVSIQGKGATKTTANCSTSCSHFATLLTNVAHVATSQYSGCARLLSKNLKGIKSIFQLQNQVLAQFQRKNTTSSFYLPCHNRSCWVNTTYLSAGVATRRNENTFGSVLLNSGKGAGSQRSPITRVVNKPPCSNTALPQIIFFVNSINKFQYDESTYFAVTTNLSDTKSQILLALFTIIIDCNAKNIKRNSCC